MSRLRDRNRQTLNENELVPPNEMKYSTYRSRMKASGARLCCAARRTTYKCSAIHLFFIPPSKHLYHYISLSLVAQISYYNSSTGIQ